MTKKAKNHILVLAPLMGMGLFLLFYGLAVITYPGGSNFDANQLGFDMKSNYLCDLLDSNTPNGLPNPARSYARLSLLVLCSSLILLWYDLPKLFGGTSANLFLMKVTSILSLGLTLFLAAGNHDVILRIAGLLGVIALISLFVALFKAKYRALFTLGVWCLLIFLLNYYIYETGFSIRVLPIIQKITFLSFLSWFAFLNIALYKKVKGEVMT